MKRLTLPEPRLAGKVTVEGALRERRSIRRFASQSLTLGEIGQLLWSVQGVTGTGGERTTPSAGGLYPLQMYLAAARVDGLEVGIYRYRPDLHDLEPVAEGDVRIKLAAASHGVEWVDSAPVVLAIGGVVQKTAIKYGARARRYVYIEVGCAAENVYLQAQSLGLGAVLVGAFDDHEVGAIMQLREGEEAMALMPVGRPRQ
ncbi:MAG: SagB/ThcOx family dehydrogenase [Thermoanaerobaculia bacterium]